MWQDILLMVGVFGFSLALIPSVISKAKPARSTCFISSLILASFCGVYASFSLWLALGATALCSAIWFILLVQKR